MKIIISVISLIIIILLGVVLKDNLFSIDIATTKNQFLQREYLSKVHEIKNVDSLYLEIEKQINFRNKDRQEQSKKAITNSRLLVIAILLVIINAFLIIRNRLR